MDNNTSPKQRHGCLTAWLILMMVANALNSVVSFIVDPSFFKPQGIDITKEELIIGAILSIFSLGFAIGLWFWKKWAFYGLALSSTLMFFTNLNKGLDVMTSSLTFAGLLILYTILQIKKEDTSGWDNLE
ncbi:hypothetical protein [Flavobacterium capsici]|uniref:Uncharacterized protein n=1 Tax=Flavobacterium capsici TaxID=3075618 RepID=A0AA96EWI7_9FLAO|nr:MULTISPECIES: hypothetical protein [unclassified Flavobacterium]WNM18458.1 hypothetical protein RN608_10590 [Flavobacterium sp. PMR2A8]WNM22509.1 hypothetical protein RN605_03890 [Flavobacterium sp. PMTSA4]